MNTKYVIPKIRTREDKDIYILNFNSDIESIILFLNENKIIIKSVVSDDYVADYNTIKIKEFLSLKNEVILIVEEISNEITDLYSGVNIQLVSLLSCANKDKIPCQLYLLYTNSFGEIYPCGRQVNNMLIGYVYENNIMDKILNFNPTISCSCSMCEFREATSEEKNRGVVNIISEIGGECNGSCVYCFQKYQPTYKQHYKFYDCLQKLYYQSNIKQATIFGGEIGVQDDSIRLIKQIKKYAEKSIISLITNGDIPNKNANLLMEYIDEYLITFHGFSEESLRLISKLDFNHIKEQCLILSNSDKHVLNVRFLYTPMVVNELLAFLHFVVNLNVRHILIDPAIIPNKNPDKETSSMELIVGDYWNPIISRLSKEIKIFFVENIDLINSKGIIFIVSDGLKNLLQLTELFNELQIKSTPISTAISNKAWKSLL